MSQNNSKNLSRLFSVPLNKRKMYTILIITNIALMSGVIAYKLLMDNPAILINQVGYLPDQQKEFLLKTRYPKYQGTFDLDLIESGDKIIEDRKLTYLGKLWGDYYYSGNFTEINTPGNYSITVTLGNKITNDLISCPVFQISDNLYDKALERAYEFFYYQRCGCEVQQLVPGYVGHEACHLDDGVYLDDGEYYNDEWVDLTGGWHSAGDFAKHNYWGVHIHGGIYSMCEAYQNVPVKYDQIDMYQKDGKLISNSIPDILDEALYGIDYVKKTFLKNGTLLGSIMGTLTFNPPESDTDGIIGTEDDRSLMYLPGEQHYFARPMEAMWAAAGIAKFGNIVDEYGYYSEELIALNNTAQYIYGNYSEKFQFPAQMTNHNGLNKWISFMLASKELFELTNDVNYAMNSTLAFQSLTENYLSCSDGIKDDLGYTDRAFAYMIEWALQNGTSNAIDQVKNLVLPNWEQNWQVLTNDATNFYGLYKIRTPQVHYFYDIHIGQNSRYLAASYASMLAYNITDGTYPELLDFAMNQLNWIFGRNPYGVSMMEDVGTYNPGIWHHRYSLIEGNMRGAVPGAIPNGMISKNNRYDKPWFDTSPWFAGSVFDHHADSSSNEPWLPHNVQALNAFSLLYKYIIEVN
ncbi:MAG: hypothetical protein GF364_07110 [Candidatus Lokiarchaeota archaeon]|nr:hypothetical protein [Candidatus Lokiarchaeota archaeon]